MDDPNITQEEKNAPEAIIERQKPAKKKKTNKELLEKSFPAEYIKQGLNGTRAYKALRPNASVENARSYASALIANPNVKKAIEELLPSSERTMSVLSEAYEAKREKNISYKELHKFWETDLKLRGKLRDNNSTNVQVNMVIDGQ